MNEPTISDQQKPRKSMHIPGGGKTLLITLFLLAFLLRLGYILQISSAPYFDDPIGDSQVYYQRALEILNGDILGKEIFFHSSPPYPYFIAGGLALSGQSIFFVYLLQILIGSGNCILIYMLAKRLANGRISPALLAGLFAVFYGLFAFFDGDMLMIFLTLFSVDLSLLLLLKFYESKKAKYCLFAGLFFGVAILDKPNLLIFIPAALFFLISEFSFHPKQWNWKPTILYLIAIGLMIFPITLRNYVVGKDFVPISSNGGVNFYIGNNPNSVGTFKLPKNSGLQDPGLYASSVAVAEKALGKTLKPSEVSNYWTGKAVEFIINQPVEELKLLGKKFLLLLNYYEVPNHQNYYYIRTEFGSLLNFMPVGFWFIVPFALAGIAWQIKSGLNLVGKLYLSFLVCYIVSLLLFFVTERYRLPMIPIYIAFAAVAIDELRRTYRRAFIFWGISLAIAIAIVYLPFQQFSYSFDRIAIGTKYFNKAIHGQGMKAYQNMLQATINYKWALETEPTLAYGHFDLGLAYEAIGFNSGAIKEYERTLQLEPNYPQAQSALKLVQERFIQEKDKIDVRSLPQTPFEEILARESTTKPETQIKLYQQLIGRDPFHYEAMNRLGQLYFQQKQYPRAIRVYKKGLALRPNHFLLLNNLAETYTQLGKPALAKQLWQKCLEIDPGNQKILQQLNKGL